MPPTEPDSRPLAHTSVTNGVWHSHSLADHLSEVARLAGDHAALFGGQDWARVAGLWHDLGNVAKAFQRSAPTCPWCGGGIE